MSTNGMTSWAVDLKDVGAIYPFQGSETLLVIIGARPMGRVARLANPP